MTYAISTYNCRGLRDVSKRQKIFKWLKEKQLEIVFLQETHSTTGDEAKWQREWGGKICFNHGKRDSKGVMVLFKPNMDIDILKIECVVEEGRVLLVDVNMNNIEMLLVNIYAPNADSPDFFKELFTELSTRDRNNLIIGGDFNLVLDLKQDKDGGRHKTNENAQKCLIKYIDTLELVDIWRIKHPSLREYTWRRRKPSTIQCRLELNTVQKVLIESGFLSDHSLVKTCFKIDRFIKGPGYWKLNCSYLQNLDYIDTIKEVIRECKIIHEGTGIDDILYWETLKMQIRGASIKYASIIK